jgi:hypothetical protein
MVAAAVLSLAVALLTLLSALMVYPAAPAGERHYAPPEARGSAFAEISGALLDRYASEDEPVRTDRDLDGETALATSASTQQGPPSKPSLTDPLPESAATAAPSISVPPGRTEARPLAPGGEEETWIAPGAKGPGVYSPTVPPPPPSRSAAPVLRVFVHFSSQAPAGRQRATALARALEDQGYVVADVREVAFAIASPKVRYFFSADRFGAERLALAARSVLASEDERRTVPVQNYTHFRPLPTPGSVEIWIASQQPRAEG